MEVFIPQEFIKIPVVTRGIPARGDLTEDGLDFWQASRKLALQIAKEVAPNKNFAQFGVYEGESAEWLIDGCETLHLFDSFEGLPTDWNGKFQKGHFACDVPHFDDDRVTIVKGLFKDTVMDYYFDRFGLVHMDADLYDSTQDVLYNMSVFKGQVFVFDEIYNIPDAENNEYKAFKEWVEYFDIKWEGIARTPYAQVVIRITG